MSKVIEDVKLDFDDVLIRPKRSITPSRSSAKLNREFKFYHSPLVIDCIPVIASNMDTTGTMRMYAALAKRKMMTALHKMFQPEKMYQCFEAKNAWISTGINDEDLARLRKLNHTMIGIPYICVDVANGYTESFVKKVAEIRSENLTAVIMAGNVCTAEMVQELIIHGGADIVKIGIGPGSVCTTRLKTGVGYPQLSAILECADAAHGLKNPETGHPGRICADGGCKTPGDIAKAFGANADFVMIGGMLAGYDECEGDWQYVCNGVDNTDKKESLRFYGMSSTAAQEKYYGSQKDYRASEGREVSVPYKGPVDDLLREIEGGLRSACSLTGATELRDLGRTTTFIRVNNTHNRMYEQ